MRFPWFLVWVLTLFLISCDQEEQSSTAKSPETLYSCIDCHELHLDSNHSLPCTSCHDGEEQAASAKLAHKDIVAHPAHPDHMAKSCGNCHADKVRDIETAIHFTLANMVNTVRSAYGAAAPLKTFLETPEVDEPSSKLELADDLLRRRCFRCHLYSQGDDYPAVHHGTGCAACHLNYYDGKLSSHAFSPPTDRQCLSCHYGNYVGADYYGRFEHDFNNEYRTPYTTKEDFFRPYGVEFHPLQADIHRTAGMICIDCHTGPELMSGNGEHPTCVQCHDESLLVKTSQAEFSLQSEPNSRRFTIKLHDGTEKILPLMEDPAHNQHDTPVDCQACHAQWAFDDHQKSYLRSDIDEYNEWSLLSVQGSSEVEHLIDNNTDFNKTELPPATTDKLTGTLQTGIWYKGYTMRRWENIPLSIVDGKITTVRPLLDIYLSWLDEDEVVRFDSVAPSDGAEVYRPYVPHTTGHAGIFYRKQINKILHSDSTEK